MADRRALAEYLAAIPIPVTGTYLIIRAIRAALFLYPSELWKGELNIAAGFVFVVLAWWWLLRGPAKLVIVSIIVTVIVALTVIIVGFAQMFCNFGIVDTSDNHIVHDGPTCLYFSVVTFTTLGYGDFRPTLTARLPAAIEALTGFLMLAAFIAAFGRAFTTLLASRASSSAPGDE